MEIIKKKANVFGEECELELITFDKSDKREWKKLFDMWRNLKIGLKNYKSRQPNFPEGLSEVAFCLYSGSKRLVSLKGKSSASFDTFNLKKQRAEQIKACSIYPDLTSFGPKSVWDDLYFLDFFNEGKLDGTFNLYKIPTEMIYNIKVNKNQTFQQQQEQGRRPRLRIQKKIIEEIGLMPVEKNIKVW